MLWRNLRWPFFTVGSGGHYGRVVFLVRWSIFYGGHIQTLCLLETVFSTTISYQNQTALYASGSVKMSLMLYGNVLTLGMFRCWLTQCSKNLWYPVMVFFFFFFPRVWWGVWRRRYGNNGQPSLGLYGRIVIRWSLKEFWLLLPRWWR